MFSDELPLFFGGARLRCTAFFKNSFSRVSRPDQLFELPDTLLQGCFVGGGIVESSLGVLVLPVIEKPRRDLMAAHQLGCGTDPAQVLFHHLALELVAERSAVLHGKILSPRLGDLGSCPVL